MKGRELAARREDPEALGLAEVKRQRLFWRTYTPICLISLAFVKGLAATVSLAKDTLGGSSRDSACLDHPVVKFFGVFSRPAMWVFHPLGRVATEIRAPHPWRVERVIDFLAPLTILITPLLQHILEYPFLPG